MATASELYELQGIDTMWLKVRRRLLQIQKQLGESEELQSVRGAVAETEEQLHLWNGRQKDADLEFQALQKRIADTDEQLMSGRVTSPRMINQALKGLIQAPRWTMPYSRTSASSFRGPMIAPPRASP